MTPTMKEIREALFPEEEKRRSEGLCSSCAKPPPHAMRDAVSAKEFSISGLCQKCQDEVFGACEPGCGHEGVGP